MAGIEFGVFDWIDRNSTPLGELYNQRLNLLERADRALLERPARQQPAQRVARHGQRFARGRVGGAARCGLQPQRRDR
jgi:hypothetical protein